MELVGEMDKIFNPDGSAAVTFVNENPDGLKTIGVATSSIESLSKQSFSVKKEENNQNLVASPETKPTVEPQNLPSNQEVTTQVNVPIPQDNTDANTLTNAGENSNNISSVVPTVQTELLKSEDEKLEDLTNREIAPATPNETISDNPLGDMAGTNSFDAFVMPKIEIPQINTEQTPKEENKEVAMPEMPKEPIASEPSVVDPGLFNINSQNSGQVLENPLSGEVLPAEPVASETTVSSSDQNQSLTTEVLPTDSETLSVAGVKADEPHVDSKLPTIPEVPVMPEQLLSNEPSASSSEQIETANLDVPNSSEIPVKSEQLPLPENEPNVKEDNSEKDNSLGVINEEFVADTPFTISNSQTQVKELQDEKNELFETEEKPKEMENINVESSNIQQTELVSEKGTTVNNNDLIKEQVIKLRENISLLLDEFEKNVINLNSIETNDFSKTDIPKMDIPNVDIPKPDVNINNNNELPDFNNALPSIQTSEPEKTEIDNLGLSNPVPTKPDIPELNESDEQLITGNKFVF